MMCIIKSKVLDIVKEPISYILLFCMIIFPVGILWGLPNSETWLSDSLAPFHPLIGLSKGFSYGYYHKYPLVHQLLLALLNIPVLVAALINSNPFEGLQLFKFLVLIQTPPYATALILIDRIVSLIMAVGLVYIVYLSSKKLFGKRPAFFTALIVSLNPLVNFYAKVAKVEIPYLFWATLAFYYCIHIIENKSTRNYVLFALFVTLSFGTKDQGYALFVLPIVVYIYIFPLMQDLGDRFRALFCNKNIWVFMGAFLFFTLVVENVFLNFDGLVTRFHALTGWNMIRSVRYTSDAAGFIALSGDVFNALIYFMGLPYLLLSFCGVVWIAFVYRNRRVELLTAMLFFVSAISYYLFFVQVARQSAHRQIFPIALFMAYYSGYAVAELQQRLKKYAVIFAILIAGMSCLPLYNSLASNYEMLTDTRYKAEEWMKNNIPAGSRIEYYAYLHYLPRIPEGMYSYRVKENVLEINKRNPDYIVLTSHYYPRFIQKIEKTASGRIMTTKKNLTFIESDFNTFFHKLFKNRYSYRPVARFDRGMSIFKTVPHAKVSPDHIIVYGRVD